MKRINLIVIFLGFIFSSCTNTDKKIDTSIKKDVLTSAPLKNNIYEQNPAKPDSPLVKCENCSIKCLVELEKRLGKLERSEIILFLNSNRNCETNIEYSEFVNELIFEVFDKDFDSTVLALGELKADQLANICVVLKNPISDRYETKTVLEKLNSIGEKYPANSNLIKCIQ